MLQPGLEGMVHNFLGPRLDTKPSTSSSLGESFLMMITEAGIFRNFLEDVAPEWALGRERGFELVGRSSLTLISEGCAVIIDQRGGEWGAVRSFEGEIGAGWA